MAFRPLGNPSRIAAALAIGLGGLLLLRRSESAPDRLRLVERLSEARLDSEGGEFPIFDEQRRLQREVTISGESLASITPPFPSRLAFDLRLPASATLELETALITMQDARRARVRFSITVETKEETATVFERERTRDEANRWEAASIDLSRWASEDVTLVLAARAVPEREGVLWASRVQTAWGDPVIRSSTEIPSAAADVESWLRVRLAALEGASTDDVAWREFTFNSLLAGLLSLCLPLVHRLGPGRGSEPLPNGFTLFTIAMTLVVAAVHSSVALSLGLLGAVSIFRFRASIPSGEHLLYLLFSIAIALPLGVNSPLLGVALASTSILVAAATGFTARSRPRWFLVTASGNWSAGSDAGLAAAFGSLLGALEVESLEMGRGRFQMSARTSLDGSRQAMAALSGMRSLIDDLRISLQAVERNP